MADETPRASRYDREVRRVILETHDAVRAVSLGDLRKVVAAAEGMGDDAEVTVEHRSKRWQRDGEWTLRSVRVTEEIPLQSGEVGSRSDDGHDGWCGCETCAPDRPDGSEEPS